MCTHTEEERILPAVPSDNRYPALPSLVQKELEGRWPAFSEYPRYTKISDMRSLMESPLCSLRADGGQGAAVTSRRSPCW